jgi:hypothetical protein
MSRCPGLLREGDEVGSTPASSAIVLDGISPSARTMTRRITGGDHGSEKCRIARMDQATITGFGP